MLDQFKQHITKKFPELLSGKTLLAVSGGVDSMVLLDLFRQLKLEFCVAHCNFQLRGQESDLDEELVHTYCEDHKIPFFVNRFNTLGYIAEHGGSIQMAARKLRYDWFGNLKMELGCEWIATAHHLDDQVETFLINFTRGTGIDGLTGIPETNGHIVRPLLPFSREEILLFAQSAGIKWREDASNSSVKYLRNKIRHLVVPVLKAENGHFMTSFQDTINYLQQTKSLADDALKRFTDECIRTENDIRIIDLHKVAEFDNSMAYLSLVFREFGFSSLKEIEKIVASETGSVLKNAKYTILKNRSFLNITDNFVVNSQEYCINSIYDVEKLPFFMNISEVKEANVKSDKNSIFVNSNLLKWPLVLRRKKTGDVFHPFGFSGKKKVSKFFKDEKLSKFQKEEAWILVNGDGRIIWLVGLRADDRFKLTNNNQQTYLITLNQ